MLLQSELSALPLSSSSFLSSFSYYFANYTYEVLKERVSSSTGIHDGNYVRNSSALWLKRSENYTVNKWETIQNLQKKDYSRVSRLKLFSKLFAMEDVRFESY